LLESLAEEVHLRDALLAVGKELLEPLEDDGSLRASVDFAGNLVRFGIGQHWRR